MATEPAQADPAEVDRAVEVLVGRRIAVLTGAGISTDSGIPDYRGEGSPRRTPMTVQQFTEIPAAHQRYWAGSHLGYRRFTAAEPNLGHLALTELEAHGTIAGVITQNVDSLHSRAGSRTIVELHGSMTQAYCLNCGQMFARAAIAERIDAENPWLDEPDAVVIAPDGDAEVTRVADFVVPTCTVCSGMLKPDVVFFGEFIPNSTYRSASALIRGAGALLIAGSSLVVNSGIRLLEQARRRDLPIVIVNRGATRGDDRATVRLNSGTSQTLMALAERLA